MKKIIYLFTLLVVGTSLSAAPSVITGFWSVHTLNFNPDGYIVTSSGDLQFLIGGSYDFNPGMGIHIESKGQLFINADPVLTCATGSWTGISFDGYWPSGTALAATIQGAPTFENCDIAIKLTDVPTGTAATTRCRDVKIGNAKFVNAVNRSISMANSTVQSNQSEIKHCIFQSNSASLQDHIYCQRIYDQKVLDSRFYCADYQTGIHLKGADIICENNLFDGHEIGIFQDQYTGPGNGTSSLTNNIFNSAADQTGIRTIGSENITISDNEFAGGDFGVRLEQTNDADVYNNEMNGVDAFGILSIDGVGNDLSFNTIDGSAVGVLVNTSNVTKILSNLITNHFIGIRTWFSTSNFIAKNEIIGTFGTSTAGIEILNSGTDVTRLESNRVGNGDILLRFDGDNTGVSTCMNTLFGDALTGVEITGVGILDQGGPVGGGAITATNNNFTTLNLIGAGALMINNLSPYVGLQFFSTIGSVLIPGPTFNAVEVSTGNSLCTLSFKKKPSVDIEAEEASLFSFYPNPIEGELTIETGNESIEEVSIFDFKGRLIFNQQVDSVKNTINLQTQKLVNGGYILLVKTNRNIYRKKLMKS